MAKDLTVLTDEQLRKYIRKLNKKTNMAMLEIHRRKTSGTQQTGPKINNLVDLRDEMLRRNREQA